MNKCETNELERKIIQSTKDSIGYHESDNKEEFLKGVDVASRRAVEILMPMITSARKSKGYAEESEKHVRSDMTTLCEIISRYSEQD